MVVILTILLLAYGEFSYSHMGSDWKGLCQTGLAQSPININEVDVLEISRSDLMNIIVNLTQIFEGQFVTDKEHSVIMFIGLGTIKINSETFDVSQIHFHSPSDHQINGLHFDLEMHLFGTSITNSSNFQVISLLFNVGNSQNQFIQNTIDSYNTINTKTFNISWVLHLGTLKSYYFYSGSVTAPIVEGDCVEGINWIVIDTPLEISKDQLQFFNNRWTGNMSFAGGNGNNRAVQKLNGRKVLHVSAESHSSGVHMLNKTQLLSHLRAKSYSHREIRKLYRKHALKFLRAESYSFFIVGNFVIGMVFLL